MKKEWEEIREQIALERYEEADRLLRRFCADDAGYDDVAAIFDASIGEHDGDRSRMWQAIRRGLLINCRNCELYVMLGNYYLEENLTQAYLCYENALYYCEDENDREQIRALMTGLREEYQVRVNRVAFVILSYNLLEYTRLCVESIRSTVPEEVREIIVVDNGSQDGSVDWLRGQGDVKTVENRQNMGFPIGCNQGIAVSSPDTDIFLLNNDTVLPENALFWLRMGLYASEKNGSAGSVSNYVSNLQSVAGDIRDTKKLMEFGRQNNVPMEYPYEEKLYLVGFALLVKRSVVQQIGGLDERFTPGNSEDEDYGLRVIRQGYKNILCKNSFILHFGSKSFSRTGNQFAEVLQKNRIKINEKYGLDTQYYFWPRTELIQMLGEPSTAPIKVLDIGCGCGAMLGHIRGLFPNAQTYGIELNPTAAEFAASMGEAVCADAEKLEMPWPEDFFDFVVMGDVLEHLREPDKVLKKVHRVLKRNGHIIVSMPNMKHYSVMLPLLVKDEFTYCNAGILDTTHLKMYTNTEIQRLITRCGFAIENIYYTMLGEPGEREKELLDKLTAMMEKPDQSTFLAYQYLVRARKGN